MSAWALSAALACGLLHGVALGQNLPQAIIQNAQTLSPDDKAQIAKYVEANSANLMSGDPVKMKRDRDALLQPLTAQGVGVPFRIEYGQSVLPKIQPMLQSPDEMVAINGLVIGGELATDNSIGVVQQKLGDKAPSVRYQAAYALSRTFQAVTRDQPAAGPAQLSGAVGAIAQQIAVEKDPLVLDGLIRAGVDAAKNSTLQNNAVSALSKSVIAAEKNLANPGDGKEVDDLLRAAVGLRDVAGKAVQQNQLLGRQAALDAAALGGTMIDRVAHMVEKSELGKKEVRESAAQLASAAQTLIQLCGENLEPGKPFPITRADGKPVNLLELLRQNTVPGDANFGQDAQLITGPNGVLQKPPFKGP